jgi:uncharacterized protein YhfF
MANELGALVVAGIKTATCSLLWEYETDGTTIPQVDEYSIILDGLGHPLCMIQTIEVNIKAFNEVKADFAYDEGENDRSLLSWRKDHWNYFSRICPTLGKTIHECMPVVCERFRVVWHA